MYFISQMVKVGHKGNHFLNFMDVAGNAVNFLEIEDMGYNGSQK